MTAAVVGAAAAQYPSRIQLKRVAGWRLRALSPDAVVVDQRTCYGNPFAVVDGDQGGAVEQFRAWITGPACVVTVQGRQWCNAGDRAPRASALRGRDLACWCPIRVGGVYVPCHADVWLSISNDIPMATVIANNTAAESGRAAARLRS